MKFRFSSALAAAALLASLGSAQAPNAFDRYASNIAVLQNKDVQRDMGITEAQRKKLNDHADWFNVQVRPIEGKLKAAKSEAEAAPHQKQLSALMDQMKSRVLGVLTAGQVKRLREISLQNAGPSSMLDTEVAKQLGIKSADLTKLRKAYGESQMKSQELQQKVVLPIQQKYEKMKPKDEADRKKLGEQAGREINAALEKVKPQIQALANAYRALLEKTVSKAQRDKFTAMLGKPVKPSK